jgi:hypothetical protein
MRISIFTTGLIQLFAVIPFLLIAGLAATCAITPAVWVFGYVTSNLSPQNEFIDHFLTATGLVVAYFTYGLSVIIVAPLLNLILGGRLKPWRGSAVSLGCIPWYVHATLTLLVRLSFLEFVTPSPITNLFYRLMGMKMGKGVTINSTAIADPSLIEMEDKVTIGGSASIMAHYAQGGYLVIAPTKICEGATIGLRAIVMGGVTVGKKAKVLAGSFVLPGSNIPDGETWGGIPAAKIDIQKFREDNL